MSRRSRLKAAGAVLAVMVLCAACNPGWTNPVAGTGDGSGTTPGSVAVAADQVALADPGAMVDLGARGYVVYDQENCAVLLVADGEVSRLTTQNYCFDTNPLGGGITADPDGNVYFSTGFDPGPYLIHRIDATTGAVSTVSGTANERIFGLSAEADGQVTYLTWVQDQSGPSTTTTWKLHRRDPAGNDSVIASVDAATADLGVPAGFVRLGDDDYSTMTENSSGQNVLVEFDSGNVTFVPVTVPGSVDGDGLIPEAVDDDGNIYGVVYPANRRGDALNGNWVFRMNPDHNVDVIAGSGEKDLGTTRQYAQGLDLNLRAQAVATTHNGNLLIASQHVVYDLTDAGHAPAAP